jgi:molybdopterin molybdotransferase
MRSLDEALDRLEEALDPLPLEAVALDEAAGRVLAEAVHADRDDPPFDRSAMDGYAVRQTEAVVDATLALTGTVRAGDPRPSEGPGPGCAFRIMTGAPIPPGADSVLILENTSAIAEGGIRVLQAARAGGNIRWRGEVRVSGAPVCAPGTFITPEVLGVLAGVGQVRVPVHAAPTVTVLSTGDELVAASQEPGPGQIRETNSWSVGALATASGALVRGCRRVPDDPGAIREAIETGIRTNVVVVSGGVSKGAFDHVRGALDALGADILFHGVAIRPGKPVLAARVNDCLVFGLPGNPVSAVIAARVFLAPALRRLQGRRFSRPAGILGRLTATLPANGDRFAFLPARLTLSDGGLQVTPVQTLGSADAVNHALGDALILREPAAAEALEGSLVPAWAPAGSASV